MATIVYDSLIYMGVAFGFASIVLAFACFLGRKRWPKRRLVLGVVIGLALCLVSAVCIMWSIVMDVREGDWQALIDTALYWAVCLTGVAAFNVAFGLAQIIKMRRSL